MSIETPERSWKRPFEQPDPVVLYASLSRYLRKVLASSGLGRIDGELLSAVVSAENGCTACAVHHAEALYAFWNDPERIDRVLQDFRTAALPLPTHLALSYAVRRAQHPKAPADAEAARLRRMGFDKKALRAIDCLARHVTRLNHLVEELWDGGL